MAEQKVTRSIIVKGSAQELYQLWTNYELHPLFSDSLKKVKEIDSKTSHWVMKGPFGIDIEWTAEMTRDDEGRRVAWRTLEGDVQNSGQVTFHELPDQQTQVTVLMKYIPPAGKLGKIGAKLLADPEERVEKDLNAFKQYAEQHVGKVNKDKADGKL